MGDRSASRIPQILASSAQGINLTLYPDTQGMWVPLRNSRTLQQAMGLNPVPDSNLV